MILQFPSQDVLQLAMQSGLIPEKVQVDPAKLLLAEDQLIVQSKHKLSRTEASQLKELSIQSLRRLPQGETTEVTCWAQLLGLSESSLEDCEQWTIMFRLDSGEALTNLVREILRLGNDRQSFRCFEYEGQSQALLRVAEPPYYSLLQAVDPSLSRADGSPPPISAYREQAPRVWVRLGYEHLWPEALSPPPGHLLLLDAPRKWEFVPEAAFRDIYQALDLSLPQPEQAWQENEDLAPSISVPLKLTAGDTLDTNSLWVLENNAMDQVEQLVTTSDEMLLGMLSFAVVEPSQDNSEPIVVLRTRPSRQAPPVLVLDCKAYRPYLNLPNLFMPNGYRLHPPLRRDAVAKILAKDKQRLIWLAPQTEGTFVPRSVPENAFRPLSDWVNYVLVHEHQSLKAWMEATQFEFEPFICQSDKAPRKKPLIDKPKKDKGPQPEVVVKDSKISNSRNPKKSSGKSTDPKSKSGRAISADLRAKPGGAEREKWVAELREAQTKFLKSDAALDDEARLTIWREIGELNANLGNRSDATLCFNNLLWNPAQQADQELLYDWVKLELRSRGLTTFGLEELDAVLANSKELHRNASLVAAFIVFNLATDSQVAELQSRLGKLTRLFEECERYLPVRTVWLAALAMHKLSAGDTLGLARTRDRLLDRLFQKGLQLEFDVPSFLRGRSNASVGSDRDEILFQRADELFQLINDWLEEETSAKKGKAQNRSYAKLMGLFVTSRRDEAGTLEALDAISQHLESIDEIHQWLAKAFRFRIEQKIKDEDQSDIMPETLNTELNALPRMSRYAVDSFRKLSRILEPHTRIDPLKELHKHHHEIGKELDKLEKLREPERLGNALLDFLIQHLGGEHEQQVFEAALELAPRAGEAGGLEIASRTAERVAQCQDEREKAKLLQRAIFLAAHFGSTDLTHDFVTSLRELLPTLIKSYLNVSLTEYTEASQTNVVETLLVESVRGLRRLGMREEIGHLYRDVETQVGKPAAAEKMTKKPRKGNSDALVQEQRQARSLRLLLCVAGGWFYFGDLERAEKITEQVRTLLFRGSLPKADQNHLAKAYVIAIASAPIDLMMERIFELFEKKVDERKLKNIMDNWTYKTHYSIAQLSFVETCLLAMFGQAQKLSPEVQRMLDEDEFLVRKKIHQDMRELI